MRAPILSRISCSARKKSVRQETTKEHPQAEHDFLMRKAAAGHRNDPPTAKLVLALLLVFPDEEGLRGPWPVQHGINGFDHSEGSRPKRLRRCPPGNPPPPARHPTCVARRQRAGRSPR